MKSFFLALSLLLTFSVYGADIVVSNAQIRVLPPGSKVTAIIFDLKNNTAKDIQLTSVDGDFAETFELHTMGMENGKMQMKKLNSIVLKKKSSTEFEKQGYHIMVFNPKADIQEGKEYNLKLHFDNKKELTIKVVGKKPF
jgi:copper(I)-binding protein